MLDLLYYGCSAIVSGVQIVIDLLKYLFHLNYEFVLSIIHAISHFIHATLFVCNQMKLFGTTVMAHIMDFILEVHRICSSIMAVFWKCITVISWLVHFCFTSITTFCLACAYYVSNASMVVIQSIKDSYSFLTTTVDLSTSLITSGITMFFFIITAVGSFCVNFTIGVWHGLGFVLSSVASFPLYCVKCLQESWTKCTNAVVDIALTITKETYLGILVLCLVYLTLSNTLHYMYCRGLSLFPRRLRTSRGTGINRLHWQFDPGFESDYEDIYGTDTEEDRTINNVSIDTDDDHDDDVESNDSDNTDDVSDDGNDSDEYTVVTEESDSDASINSQTFSTESSDHEIDVQLPPVDERYSLRNRSSTPFRVPKTMSSLEEFNREMEMERDKRKCVVCQDEIKSVLVLPCKHMCMCVLCADQIVRSRMAGRRVCPLCRTKITKVMNIYV